MKCRHCHNSLALKLIDLRTAPPSNSYVSEANLEAPESWFPLRVFVCSSCWLVQTEDFANFEDLFSRDYAYFSSVSSSWLAHAKKFALEMMSRLELKKDSLVGEIASNDGYLLQYFKQFGVGCYGVEPTHSTAEAAREKGIVVHEEFFGEQCGLRLRQQGLAADLLVANNVLAHVPAINDFVRGFSALLKETGVASFEFPHLLRLVESCQFDTIYHEHFSYLSLHAVKNIFESNGLSIFDVEELGTHGGSLRVFAQLKANPTRQVTEAVGAFLHAERSAGICTEEYYFGFQQRANAIKDGLIKFLIEKASEGKTVVGYGAAAKGNTLLNFSGVRNDWIPWVVDRSQSKQGKFLPGSRIPIVDESFLVREKPDFVLILPWNLRAEVCEQLAYVRNWGGSLLVAVPELMLL